MSKKCPECGAKLDKQTGRCPNCEKGYQKADASRDRKKESVGKSSNKKKPEKKPTGNRTLKRVIAGAIAVACVCIVLLVLSALNIIRLPSFGSSSVSIGMTKEDDSQQVRIDTSGSSIPEYIDPDTLTDDEIEEEVKKSLTPVDAEAYFNDIGTLKAKTKVSDAKNVTSEEDTVKMMDDRGFNDIIITSEYKMDGEYYAEEMINSNSSETHPVYKMAYADAKDREWLIYISNGAVNAYLFSYAADHPDELPVFLSESDTLTGYDSYSNAFYEYVPDAQTAQFTQVAKIDVQTLNAFEP